MIPERIQLDLPKSDLMELYRALMVRHVVECTQRHEQGLEPAESPSLERLEKILGLDEEQAHLLFHEMEDELWQYAWYTYTDEWAWFRAQQEAQKELGSKNGLTKRETFERLVEACYDARFEEFAAEIDMKSLKTKGNETKEMHRSRKGNNKQ